MQLNVRIGSKNNRQNALEADCKEKDAYCLGCWKNGPTPAAPKPSGRAPKTWPGMAWPRLGMMPKFISSLIPGNVGCGAGLPSFNERAPICTSIYHFSKSYKRIPLWIHVGIHRLHFRCGIRSNLCQSATIWGCNRTTSMNLMHGTQWRYTQEVSPYGSMHNNLPLASENHTISEQIRQVSRHPSSCIMHKAIGMWPCSCYFMLA